MRIGTNGSSSEEWNMRASVSFLSFAHFMSLKYKIHCI